MYESELRRPYRRKEDLEKQFLEHLARLPPRPEYLKLFNAIVLDVWKQKRNEASAQLAALDRQLEQLRQRKDKLDEAFIYRQAVSKETYQRQSDKISEEITLAEMAAHDTRLDELDIEAVLNFSQHVILNAARLWIEFSLDQKQRLQKVIFPEGLTYSPDGFGTAVASPIFNILGDGEDGEKIMAPQVGLEPTTLRLTAGCSAIELLRSKAVSRIECARYYNALKPVNQLSH